MHKEYRNTAFLLELLINVLVFIIVCAVLLGVLADAKLITQQTNDQTRAGNELFAVLEMVRAGGMEALESNRSAAENEATLYYDAGWHVCGQEQAAYSLHLVLEQEPVEAGVLEHARAAAHTRAGEELLVMETSFYRPAA